MRHPEPDIDALRKWVWRPHPVTRFGTLMALVLALVTSALLIFSSDSVVEFFREHPVGGMVGSAKAEDQLLGLSIMAGFGWLMSVVGAVINLQAWRSRSQLFDSLSGAKPHAVVWMYREITEMNGDVEHVLTFALGSGRRVRATVPTDQIEAVWLWARAQCPGVSTGHDVTQERVFAVSPERMRRPARNVEGIQRLSHRHRAR